MTHDARRGSLELSEVERGMLAILDHHRGAAQAIGVPVMAERLGIDDRKAQQVKRHLVELHGVCIGSSCGSPPGWYLPETEAEVEATVQNYRSRLKSLARLIAKTQRAVPSEVAKQCALELLEEDGEVRHGS